MDLIQSNKIKGFKECSNSLNEFMEFLDGNVECVWVDEEKNQKIRCAEDILFDLLNIDRKALEEERKFLLDQQRQANK